METTNRLELLFTNQEGRQVTIALDDPNQPADVDAVNDAMDTIVDENIFYSSGGRLVGKRGARIVTRTVETIDID